ncbi:MULTISPECIES: hypothetical protein [Lactobacillus]|uniref:hypothetical protein n=1 Tax=Lactobacillus TaxID=1578 RepID=UPI00143DCFCF|nr:MULTISPECIES: hypothetical protein [Lactobacillus]
MKIHEYKNKPSHEDDLDEKINKFDEKVCWDYLIPIFVSLVTTLLTLAALSGK